MAFVQFSQVSLAFGDRDILNSVSLNLASGTKASLAGANGSGKSTLMKVLAGTIQADSGERAIQKNTLVSYLPQSGIIHTGKTLLDEVETAFARGFTILTQYEALGEQLSKIDPQDPKAMKLAEEHHELQLALEETGWHRRKTLSEQTLMGLGFTQKDFSRKVDEFSGGWQMRVALAKILLEHPDILLLDEPTNYLDLEARNWLESWLNDFTGGYLLVSHDRFFLDSTVNEVYELFNGSLKRYAGTYTQYEKVRAVELESLIKRYDEQREEIAKTNDFIRRFRYNASKAGMVQGRIKQLEKMELIEIPENLKKMHFRFPPAPHTGRLIITTDKLHKSWANHTILDSVDIVVEKQERLVVVGRNGAGKSTLLRILAGQDNDYSGTVTLGAGVLIGYFSQDNAETLTGSERIIDLLENEAPLDLIPKLRDMLGSFLFRGDDIYKPINVLSGGEKSRLALLRLLFKPLNVLILDEPTNHLDLHSKDVLLDALKNFGGTILFVSHDRGFIEELATRVLEISASDQGLPSMLRSFPGDYRYYLERIEREALGLEQVGSRQNSPKTQVESKVTNAVASQTLSREEEKRLKAERRKLEREEARLLAEISQNEAALAKAEKELSDPAVYSDLEKCRSTQQTIERIRDLIDEFSEAWESISIQLEELQ